MKFLQKHSKLMACVCVCIVAINTGTNLLDLFWWLRK